MTLSMGAISLTENSAPRYYLKSAAPSPVKISVTDLATGATFRDLEGPSEAGINRVRWNLRGNAPAERRDAAPQGRQQVPLATSGTYRVTVTVGGRNYSRVIVVEDDRWMDQR
jgi:hypothetical protein